MSLADVVRELPPLIALLEIRTRSSEHGGKSKDRGIPIDADALELWGQVRDELKVWAKRVHSRFDDADLVRSFKDWAEAFAVTVVPDSVVDEVVATCEDFIRRIRNKYDPPKLLEWKSPCPKCHAVTEHVNRKGVKVAEFANSITVNVTDRVAECSACGERFEGDEGIKKLRLLTNVGDELSQGRQVDKAALAMYFEYRGVSEVA